MGIAVVVASVVASVVVSHSTCVVLVYICKDTYYIQQPS